jgi:hypothetical protein
MTPSFIGRYAIISSGVRPTISFASLPTARILFSLTETATTDGSFSTIPLPGTNTSTVVVPRSMPSFGRERECHNLGIVCVFWGLTNRAAPIVSGAEAVRSSPRDPPSQRDETTQTRFCVFVLVTTGLPSSSWCFFGLSFPPELFGEILRIVADAFEVVEIFGRYLLVEVFPIRPIATFG